MSTLRTYVAAHRKAILVLVSLLAVQLVDSETADWLTVVAGTLLTLIVPNDPEAIAKVYRRR